MRKIKEGLGVKPLSFTRNGKWSLVSDSWSSEEAMTRSNPIAVLLVHQELDPDG